MPSFKEQCIRLREKDLSINEIVEITGRAKSSIYPHIKDMPLSKARLQQYRRQSTQQIISFNNSRRGKSILKRSPKDFEKWTPSLVLLFAHSLFDGTVSKGTFAYNSSHPALISRVKELMPLIYSYEPILYKNVRTGVDRVSYHSVELQSFVTEKQAQLLEKISVLDTNCQKHFLKGFFDDEGCVQYRVKCNMRRVRGYQHNPEILELVHRLLKNFGIESTVRYKENAIVITRKENLIRFQKEINFSPGVCVNGNRSNSMWGESLEKREILARAIVSYQ